MTFSNQNIIHRSAFNFEYGNQASASRCNNMIESIFIVQILPELEKAISKHIPEGLHIELSKLEIDIGHINEKEIPGFLAGRIGTALKNALQNKIKTGSAADGAHTSLEKSSNQYLLQLLETFLQKGYFPLGMDNSFTFDDLLAKIIGQNKSGFPGILKKYRNSDTAINRLVLNVNRTTLDLVLQTLASVKYKWIADYRDTMLKAKMAGNIQQFSGAEFIRTLNFLIVKYLLNKTSSDFIGSNFSNYLLKELKPLAGANFPVFIQAAQQFDATLSESVFINGKKRANGKENSALDTSANNIEWTIENLMEWMNDGGGLKNLKPDILREKILEAIFDNQKRTVLLERLNITGAAFLIGLFSRENAKQYINLIDLFAGKVVEPGNLKITNHLSGKNISLVNHLVLQSVLYFAESSVRKFSKEEFVLFLMYSAGMNLSKTVQSEDFRRFIHAEKTISIEKVKELIDDEKSIPEISTIQKALAEQKHLTYPKSSNPDIRLTEEFILASKRKIISYYLEKGILPDGYNNLSKQDLQTIFAGLIRQNDNFLVLQFKNNEDDENWYRRLNELISASIHSDLEAYLIYFFKKESEGLLHFISQSKKLSSFKNQQSTENQKKIVELFTDALACSKGGMFVSMFKLSVIENLFFELNQDLADPAGFMNFLQNQPEDSSELNVLHINLNPDAEIKKALERDFNQILKTNYFLKSGENAASQNIKRLIKSLGFYFVTHRNLFLEVLQKNKKDFMWIFALMKFNLPVQLWKQISKSVLQVTEFQPKAELFRKHSAVILKDFAQSDSKTHFNLAEAESEKANVFLHIMATNKALLEQFVSKTPDSEILTILRFEDKETQAIFNRLYHFFPVSLLDKTEVNFWKSLVIRYSVLTITESKKIHPAEFAKGFLHYLVQNLKSIQKAGLFYPILEELKINATTELQEIAAFWQNSPGLAASKKTTENQDTESALEIVRTNFSVLKFYSEHGFLPWWAGNLSFPELFSGIKTIRQNSPGAFEYLEKQLENEENIYEGLLKNLSDSAVQDLEQIFRDRSKFAEISKKVKKEKSTGAGNNLREKELFQQEIYSLSDTAILKRWKNRDPKIAVQISEYIHLSPYFYFRNINPAQWRKTVYEFSNEYYKAEEKRYTDHFHADFLKYLKQKYPAVNWNETYTKVYLLVQQSKSGVKPVFPEALFQLLDISSKINTMTNTEDSMPAMEEGDQVRVSNSGLILFWPFLTRLFEIHNFIKNGAFVNPESKNRAVYLLQQLVYNEINFPEHQLVLNKLLVGIPAGEHLVPIDALNDEEIESTKSLMNGFISNWDKVKNSTHVGIQETFLQRDGILTFKNDQIVLTVEKKGVDVLMQTIPWNISLVKLSWMKLPVFVEWI